MPLLTDRAKVRSFGKGDRPVPMPLGIRPDSLGFDDTLRRFSIQQYIYYSGSKTIHGTYASLVR
ncbi:MAG: hypothetical protein VKJ46_05375 [Leptolyngbyaceae bacterium]|nr:hypothetical protein [Leptolyngbyaceae bacterium]